MKKVFIFLGVMVAASVVIKQLVGGKKHILTRKDDPSIPPISSRVF